MDATQKVMEIAAAYAEAQGVELESVVVAETPSINWWRVGRNASHYFYLGLDRGGKVWRSAYCYDDMDPDLNPEISAAELAVHPIARFATPVEEGRESFGYMGHF